MGRIEEAFAKCKAEQRGMVMPFVVAGVPRAGDLSATLTQLEAGGAMVTEIGFPFSDPIADGPVIAQAMGEALRGGMTAERVFEEVKQVRPWLSMGLVAMVSASIVHRCGGPEGFASRAKAAGFDGLLVPDVPLEEIEPYSAAAKGQGLSLSMLVSPTTPPARAELIVKACSGFVYVLARAGLTGEREGVPEVSKLVTRLRGVTELPLACGFGISTADQVRAVVWQGNGASATRLADAAIVGSAFVRVMQQASQGGEAAASAAAGLLAELSRGLLRPA